MIDDAGELAACFVSTFPASSLLFYIILFYFISSYLLIYLGRKETYLQFALRPGQLRLVSYNPAFALTYEDLAFRKWMSEAMLVPTTSETPNVDNVRGSSRGCRGRRGKSGWIRLEIGGSSRIQYLSVQPVRPEQ